MWAREQHSVTLTPGQTDAHMCLTPFLNQLHGTEGGSHPPGVTIGGMWISGQVLVTGSGNASAAQGSACLGVGVFDEVTAGEVPSPLVDPHSDWMAYVPLVLNFPPDTTTSFADFSGDEAIQVRSKRRMDEIGERLWCSWDLSGIPGGYQTNIRYFVSTLLLMP